MTSSKIVLGAASGAAGGAGLDVDEVFSTHLWTGNSSTQTINNGLDLSTEGGLVWIKKRSGNSSHFLFGSDRDANNKALLTNTELGYYGTSYSVTHSSTGFGISSTSSGDVNENGQDYVSWSFRVAEKFFDVVVANSISGSGNTISHSLGCDVGMIIAKKKNGTDNWYVWHKGINTGSMYLNGNNATGSITTEYVFGNGSSVVQPTSTQFTFGAPTSGDYVFYLFAHNDSGDGGFGPDGDQDIIKCGSFTSDGSGGATVNLGFEPQWLMYKPSSTTGPWVIVDSMRGWTANAESRTLTAESIGAEQSQVNLSSSYPLNLRSNGFDTSNALYASQTYIYMAIRRGSLFPPEAGDATKVFGSLAYTGNGASDREYTVGSAVSDMLFQACRSSSSYNYPHLSSRLTGKGLTTASTGSEVTLAYQFDKMDGVHETGFENTLNQSSQTFIMHSWKRAPSYFDVCAYSGSGTATQPHSLSASPEIIWIKQRDGTANWTVLTNFTSTQYDYLYLNQTSAATTVNYSANEYLSAAPTATGIPFVDYYGVNDSNPQQKYIAYLFASVAGLSKISSVVHSGTTNVDAGFSNGSRFVLLKRTDATGDWLIWDGTRGIVSGNDPYLLLNSAAAEVTNTDYIDPLSSGFTLTSNLTSGTYIYYAIA